MTGPDAEYDTGDHYDLLGVAPDADAVALRAAYLIQAKRWHPDVQVNAQPGDDRPSTWLARASLSAVASRLEDGAPRPVGVDRHGAGVPPTPLLGDLVGQSLWVMGHELWAELDADQRGGLVDPPDTSGGESSSKAGPCSVCGRLPTASFSFRAVRGRGLTYRCTPIGGAFCRDCALGIGRDAQHVTLSAGWWGVLAVLRTPLALWTNGRTLRRAQALAPATGEPAHRRAPMDPGAPVLGRGITGAVLFGLLVLLLVVVSQVF